MIDDEIEEKMEQVETDVLDAMREKQLTTVNSITAYLKTSPGLVLSAVGRLFRKRALVHSELTGDGEKIYLLTPFYKMTPDELTKRVLWAIDNKYRLLISIRREIGAPDEFDLEDLLNGLCNDYTLRKEPNGKVDAYFRYETKPLRFWLCGSGAVDAEWDDSFVPRDEKKKQLEYATNRKSSNEGDDMVLDLDGDKPKPGQKGKKSRTVTPEALEYAVSCNADIYAVAKALDIDLSVLNHWIDNDVELTMAFYSGRKKNQINPQMPRHPAASEKPRDPKLVSQNGAAPSPLAAVIEEIAEAVDPAEDDDMEEKVDLELDEHEDGPTRIPGIQVKCTIHEVEEAAATLADKALIADRLGYASHTSLDRLLRTRDGYREAYDRGRERYIAANPDAKRRRPYKARKKRTDEPAAEAPLLILDVVSGVPQQALVEDPAPAPRYIGMDVTEKELIHAPVQTRPAHTMRIDFSAGTIDISMDMDLFKTTPKQRVFLNELIELVQSQNRSAS